MSSMSWLQISMTSARQGSIIFGANAGSNKRRASLWNGGSEEIGGTGPIGAPMRSGT